MCSSDLSISFFVLSLYYQYELCTYGAAGAPEALDQPGQNARNADDPPEPSARDACDFAGSPASVAADVASAANAVDVAARRAVDLYSDLILRLSYTYLKSTHDAEDICQTILMKLLMRPGGFENVEHEKAWVVRATANACKDILRSKGFAVVADEIRKLTTDRKSVV